MWPLTSSPSNTSKRRCEKSTSGHKGEFRFGQAPWHATLTHWLARSRSSWEYRGSPQAFCSLVAGRLCCWVTATLLLSASLWFRSQNYRTLSYSFLSVMAVVSDCVRNNFVLQAKSYWKHSTSWAIIAPNSKLYCNSGKYFPSQGQSVKTFSILQEEKITQQHKVILISMTATAINNTWNSLLQYEQSCIIIIILVTSDISANQRNIHTHVHSTCTPNKTDTKALHLHERISKTSQDMTVHPGSHRNRMWCEVGFHVSKEWGKHPTIPFFGDVRHSPFATGEDSSFVGI